MTRLRPLAVLLDIDGTLLDTVPFILASMHHAFEGRTSRPSEAEWVSTIGTPLRVQLAPYTTGEADLEALTARYRAHQHALAAERTHAFPGALEAVRELSARGHPIGVVTGKLGPGAARGLELAGFGGLVGALVSADSCPEHKPHPGPVLLALARLDRAPSEAVFVGDAPVDVQAGKAAGVVSVGALWGAPSREALLAAHPDHLLTRVEELSPLVARLQQEREAAAAGGAVPGRARHRPRHRPAVSAPALPPLRVVLLRPRNPENLGACARAMKNFGLGDWAVVELGTHDFAAARRVAVHAEELLDRPRLCATLDEAVADCAWVVGTSSRPVPGRRRLPPAAVAREVVARAPARTALVFGDERSGLSNAEVLRCHDLSAIPSGEEQPSLNLAQAVLVYCYALREAALGGDPPPRPRAAAATDAELSALREVLRGVLRESGFLAGPERHAVRDLCDTLVRSRLTRREAALWSAALRKVRRAL